MIDPDNLFKMRLYRQHCISIKDKFFVKDMRIFKDRELKDVVLVDNSIISFAFNINNGVPCSAFYRHMKEDEEFLYLVSYLEEIFSCDDVRDFNSEKFNL